MPSITEGVIIVTKERYRGTHYLSRKQRTCILENTALRKTKFKDGSYEFKIVCHQNTLRANTVVGFSLDTPLLKGTKTVVYKNRYYVITTLEVLRLGKFKEPLYQERFVFKAVMKDSTKMKSLNTAWGLTSVKYIRLVPVLPTDPIFGDVIIKTAMGFLPLLPTAGS
jgi:hypothetical protein